MKQATLGKAAGFLTRLILVILMLGAGAISAKAVAPKITGSVEHIGGDWLHLKIDPSLTPGVRFYPVTRVILDDGTWVSGYLGCFPTGAKAGTEAAGTFMRGPVPRGRVPKRVEIMACVGEPNDFFGNPGKGHGFKPLDGATLKELSRAGGFLIRVPFAK